MSRAYRAPVRLDYDAETEGFRAELRAWLAEHQPDPEAMRDEPCLSSAHLTSWARAWQRRLFDAGWLVPGWPPELGGRHATPIQQLVYFEELARTPVIRAYNIQGLTIIAPSIRDYASASVQERFLLPTLRAEISWCLGMSEPGAGSDLASLSTRATLRDDVFIVDGQKVWTSGAAHADLCFCFVRTDPEAPKHRGISVLVIDMKSPGIDVRPLPDLVDPEQADFNQVYFDAVRVPAENLVGELNAGWSITTGSLAHERGMLWTSQVTRIEQRIEDLIALGREPDASGRRRGDDAAFRDRVAGLYVDSQALKFMGYQGFAKAAQGEASPEHSLMKLLGSELEQALALFAMEAQGPSALDFDPSGPAFQAFDGPPSWPLLYLRSFSNTIAGGTSEIQRNIIAQRVLGLPRG
jgi:alkylation response protein AidB-like acyl-CoA dehydrogenase